MNGIVRVLADICTEVRGHADELNELDRNAGDGDLGVTMSAAADALLELLPQLESDSLAQILRACGSTIARAAPSTAGTLVATGLLRAAAAAPDDDVAPAARLASLLDAARQGISERGKAEVGSKTMLDALVPAAAAAAAAAGSGLGLALLEVAEAAAAGAQATTTMIARHGRAGWLAERSMGHEDAGARLIALALGAAARSVESRSE